jgi:hypothetical protein
MPEGNEGFHIGPFYGDFVPTPRQRTILSSLATYYSSDVQKKMLAPMLSQTMGTSLRALDWLVTNFSKKHNVMCRDARGRPFNIHQGYKVALSVNKRRHFDPFRRRTRVRVQSDSGDVLESTVGQLNFLHWASERGVLGYLDAHTAVVEDEMNETTRVSRQHRAARPNASRSKRGELTRAPSAPCSVYRASTTVSFGAVLPAPM